MPYPLCGQASIFKPRFFDRLLPQVDTILRKQQEKEKQMWGKAFS